MDKKNSTVRRSHSIATIKDNTLQETIKAKMEIAIIAIEIIIEGKADNGLQETIKEKMEIENITIEIIIEAKAICLTLKEN